MAQELVGLFQACYKVSRDNVGGETATFKWLVNATNGTITGSGHLTQPVNPPTNIGVPMTGHFEEDDAGNVVAVVAGSIPGASIQVVLELPRWGASGKARILTWLANNHYFSDQDVPAKPIDCQG